MNIAPGLNGLLAQRQFAQQEQNAGLGQIQGLLGVQNAMFEQQLNPLKMEQLKVQLADAKRKSELVNGLLAGGNAGAPAPVQMVNGKPMEGGMSVPGQAPRQGGLLGAVNDPQTVMALKLAGIGDLTEMYKYFNTPQERKGGSFYVNPITGAREFIQKVGEGMNFGEGGAISDAPGYVDTVRRIDSAKEGAKADFDIVQVPDGRGGMISMPRSLAIQRMNGANAQQSAPQAAPTHSMAPDPLAGRSPAEIAAIRQVQQASANGQPMSVNVPAVNTPASGPIPTSRIVGGFGQAPNPVDVKVEEKRALGAVEKAGELPQAQLRVETQVGDIRRLMSLAQEITKSPSLDRAVGIATYAPSIRGGGAAGTEALIASLKSQVSGMKLQAMRDASKTGGAVGNVTEKEWPRLESMIVALDQEKMSPALFREKLGELVLALRDAESNITKAFKSEYGSVGGSAPSAGGWAVVK